MKVSSYQLYWILLKLIFANGATCLNDILIAEMYCAFKKWKESGRLYQISFTKIMWSLGWVQIIWMCVYCVLSWVYGYDMEKKKISLSLGMCTVLYTIVTVRTGRRKYCYFLRRHCVRFFFISLHFIQIYNANS